MGLPIGASHARCREGGTGVGWLLEEDEGAREDVEIWASASAPSSRLVITIGDGGYYPYTGRGIS